MSSEEKLRLVIDDKLQQPGWRIQNRKKLSVTVSKYMLLLLALTALTGCKSDARVDDPETVKEVHAQNEEAQAQKEEVQVKNEGEATPEPEDATPSPSPEKTQSKMEIYEGVLNGKITLEKENEQVYISDLFWDNDIEYCFADIDGDGSEELHIRDNLFYYMIKVKDKSPQIIFESWWGYEPVVTGEQRGILFFVCGYGSERIKFMKISPDGSTESDGMYSWGDINHNGKIDEGDRVSVNHNEIDAQRYIRYREEQIAGQMGNELEWTNRRLKSFAAWQEAYIDFITKLHVTFGVNNEYEEYSLIYVDEDDIPELFIFTGGMATGEIIASFYDGKVRAMNRDRCGMEYLEYGGLLYNMNGNMGFDPANIYRLSQGEFSEIGTGWSQERIIDEENVYFDYFWEDKQVTEEEYMASINALIDTSKCKEPPFVCSKEEILEMLSGRDRSSAEDRK